MRLATANVGKFLIEKLVVAAEVLSAAQFNQEGNGMSKRHNMRQRKKLHLGEFKELGFELSAEVARELSDDERDQILDSFLSECIEANGMLFGGGINRSLGGFIESIAVRGSATEEQRERVREWLQGRSEFRSVTVGPLVDAWHEVH